MSFQTGYAQAVITPSLERPVYLAGFGRNRRAETIHDDLYVRAPALASNGRFVIVVALDLIGLHWGQCQAVAQRVTARLPNAQMLIACTHTHHGPDTLGLWGPDEQTSGVDEAYMAGVLEMVAETAVAATLNLQEALLAGTSVIVPGVAKNLRDPHITDEELTCLQFRTVADRRPFVTWLIFPCHPEVLWDENPHIASDYIFTLRQCVEADTGAPCLVHVGALGGMMSPDVVDHSFAEAATMGETLAQAAQTVLHAAQERPVTRFSYHRHEFAVPLENPLFEMAAATGLLPEVQQADGNVLTAAGLLRLSDACLFAVPGELLPRLGLHYRKLLKEAGAQVTAVIGLANDELGYILPAEDFTPPENYLDPGSSYEESMSVGREIGPRLTAALHTLLGNDVQ
ncbi:MAG: hypothetical protein ACE5EY_09115 [Anaerolineae bacterium]